MADKTADELASEILQIERSAVSARGTLKHYGAFEVARGYQEVVKRIRNGLRRRKLENEIHEWEESDAAASVLDPICSERIAELEARIAELTAPVMVECPDCAGTGRFDEIADDIICDTCNGAKQVPDPRLAEIRKRDQAAWKSTLKGTQCCDQRIDGAIGAAIEEIDHARADIPYLLDRLSAQAAMLAEARRLTGIRDSVCSLMMPTARIYKSADEGFNEGIEAALEAIDAALSAQKEGM